MSGVAECGGVPATVTSGVIDEMALGQGGQE